MLYPQANANRSLIDLSGIWNFKPDYADIGESRQWHTRLVDGAPIAVPASFNDQTMDASLHNHMGAVWYEKEFDLPHEMTSRRVFLHFGAANYRAKVWLNGETLGTHEGAFVPFEFEATALLHRDGKNHLSVRTDYVLSLETIPQDGKRVGHGAGKFGPKFPPMSSDHFPYGGLIRPVVIYSTDLARIVEVKVDTAIEGSVGLVRVGLLADGPADACTFEVDESRETVALEDGRAECQLEIPHVVAWGPETPKLYPLRLQLYSRKKVVDTHEIPIGVRSVRVEGENLLLNGKPIFLKGVCRQEDFTVDGAGMNCPAAVRDLSNLRYLGANCVRTMRYPHSEEWMSLCDREGILVIDEPPASFLFHFEPTLGASEALTEKTKEAHKRSIFEMIRRDYNHPSVIMWNLASDLNAGVSEAGPYFKEIMDYARSLDKSRPVTYGSSNAVEEDFVAQHADVIMISAHEEAWAHGGDWEKVKKAVGDLLDGYNQKYTKPILVGEFGISTLSGFHSEGEERWTEEHQWKHLANYMEVFSRRLYLAGIHVGTLTDFKSQQHFGRVIFNREGLFTRDREPKLAAHSLAKLWAGKGLLVNIEKRS